jgi:hypothetical protein
VESPQPVKPHESHEHEIHNVNGDIGLMTPIRTWFACGEGEILDVAGGMEKVETFR